MDYVPHTPEDQKEMLRAIGAESLEALFADIPATYRLNRLLDLPAPLAEQEIWEHMSRLAARNRLPVATLTGAGAYRHYIPAVVSHIVGRSEFYTAYTPYQAEISQGILQAIYEYQTMITRLTGTQVANASMYDGATAMAEAAVLSAKSLGRSRLLVARSVHPEYRKVLGTYAWANGYACEEVPFGATGQLERDALRYPPGGQKVLAHRLGKMKAVRAEQAEERPPGHREVQGVDRDRLPVALRETLRLDHQGHETWWSLPANEASVGAHGPSRGFQSGPSPGGDGGRSV